MGLDKVQTKYKDAIYFQILTCISEMFDDEMLKNFIDTEAPKCGLSNVRFTGPQIITYDDGCSHQTWESSFKSDIKYG